MNIMTLRFYSLINYTMDGCTLAMFIISPIGCCIGMYQYFNNGNMPFLDISNIDNLNKVAVEG
jgi:hypothetical protein